MRDFFINWAEKLLTVLIVLLMIGVVLTAIGVMFTGQQPGGFLAGLLVLVLGPLYVIILGGAMYVSFGIFRNTQETNRLLAELLRK
ncbi:MAG: hypothetical protein ACK5II_03560 [Paracoccus sp. (in: a-proteobacteria)]